MGEIWVRGDSVSQYYWEQPEATAAMYVDGWFRMGDLAVRDEDGYVTIVDRKNDMIISGGLNVYPREVEDVVASHPAVREVAVIGVPDPKWGEAVKACVSLTEGRTLTLEEAAGALPAAGAGLLQEAAEPRRRRRDPEDGGRQAVPPRPARALLDGAGARGSADRPRVSRARNSRRRLSATAEASSSTSFLRRGRNHTGT